MTQELQNEKIVKRAMNSYLSGNGDDFFGAFDDDTILIEPEGLPYGGRYRGAEAAKKAMLEMNSCWRDWQVKPEHITTGGEYVIVLVDFSAVGVPTGLRVSFPIAEVWHFRAGKLLSLHPIYGDTAAARTALGFQVSRLT